MQTVKERQLQSSVLIVSALPLLESSSGADQFERSQDGLRALHQRTYDVVVLSDKLILDPDFRKALDKLKVDNPSAQLILISDGSVPAQIIADLYNDLKISSLIQTTQLHHLDHFIFGALEKANQEQQNLQLQDLIKDQSNQLTLLYQELEDRVGIRQKFLEESRRKTILANLRWDALREAMMAIHRALSISEMEKLLSEALAAPMDISLIRIFFKPQDSYFANQNKTYQSFSMFQAPLFQAQGTKGSIFFLREVGRSFNRDEGEFLQRVSDAAALALDRLSHLEQSEILREQWQATFNAISDSVILINSNYEVLQANTSARSRSKQKSFVQPKCYQMLFQRESPCPHCSLGRNFRLDGRQEILDVSSQAIDHLYFNLYHDVSAQLKMEKKILETARLAELGTIGSSIAHELNNPLGGILSFVQLIKMDLKKDDPLIPDIDEMENGVKRCRDIIENLLGFTRNPDVDSFQEIDLKEVILRAIKIVELQTKTQNIEIKPLLPHAPAPVKGHFNMLSQAIKNFLQLSIDALVERQSQLKSKGGFLVGSTSVIEISLESSAEQWVIKILDNGPGTGRRNSLQYSISTQIIHEHEGLVEVSAQPRQMTMAKISLPQCGF